MILRGQVDLLPVVLLVVQDIWSVDLPGHWEHSLSHRRPGVVVIKVLGSGEDRIEAASMLSKGKGLD